MGSVIVDINVDDDVHTLSSWRTEVTSLRHFMTNSVSLLSSDILLALLLPLLIVCVGFKNRLFSFSSENHHSQPSFSPQRAYTAFSSYAFLSERELDAKRASYVTLSRVNKRLAQKIGYERKLDTLKEVIRLNATVAVGIAQLIEDGVPIITRAAIRTADSKDLSLVREAFKHFVRDWSVQGRTERNQIFDPILNVLRGLPLDKRREMKVLVPGCGLGRLAWEVSELGQCPLPFLIPTDSL